MFFVSPSIKEAFKNGSGDVCWKNEFGFVFISRHDDPEKIRNQGFQIVPYEDVLKIDSEQNPKKEAARPRLLKSPRLFKRNSFIGKGILILILFIWNILTLTDKIYKP